MRRWSAPFATVFGAAAALWLGAATALAHGINANLVRRWVVHAVSVNPLTPGSRN